MEEQWLTIPEAARHYAISENAVRQRMKRRHFEGCEKREGLWYIKVEADQPPTSLTTTDQPQLAAIERLVAAQEETNALLRLLLEQGKQPPARAEQKWKWPWQHE